MGVGVMERLVNSDDGSVRISLPAAGDVVAVLNSESNQPFHQITAIYWKVSTSSVQGVVDKIRTKLAELAELTAEMPDSAATLSAAQAAAAISFVVTTKEHGRAVQCAVNQRR